MLVFDADSLVKPAVDVILKSGGARACIAKRGGEWRAWSIDGIEMLWPGDPAVWAGVAPVLFPVVGWTRDGRVRVGGSTYELGVHGFAADAEFELRQAGNDRAILVLRDGPQTRANYPFSFCLEVEYQLQPASMAVVFSVVNTGGTSMPYAVGLHPGFNCPLAGSEAQHAIVFAAPERPEVPVIAPGGLFSARRRPVPLAGTVLRLSPDLFADEALCFLDVASRSLVYDNGAGQGLRVTTDNFPHVALWARPPAFFLAIESWTGHGDPENFEGDLFEKPSMMILEPGTRGRHSVRYEFLADGSQVASGLQAASHLPKERPNDRGNS